MKTRGDAFGRGCLLVSLTALYGLLGMRLFVAWREGLWLVWPLGDYLPDSVVRWVFSLSQPAVRAALAWAMGQDVLYVAAVVSLLLWLLAVVRPSSETEDDGPPPR